MEKTIRVMAFSVHTNVWVSENGWKVDVVVTQKVDEWLECMGDIEVVSVNQSVCFVPAGSTFCDQLFVLLTVFYIDPEQDREDALGESEELVDGDKC